MDPQWYTKKGPDGQWYKTQANSQDEAISKMSKAWGAHQVAPTGTISAAKPEDWFQQAREDVQQGGTRTWLGKGLTAMGAKGTSRGVPEEVGNLMAGPVGGVPEMGHGVMELPSHPLRGAMDIASGLFHTTGLAAAATQPEFIPTAIRFMAFNAAAEKIGQRMGLQPETNQFISMLLAAGATGATLDSGARARAIEAEKSYLRASRGFGAAVDENVIAQTAEQNVSKAEAQANTASNIAKRTGQNIAQVLQTGANSATMRHSEEKNLGSPAPKDVPIAASGMTEKEAMQGGKTGPEYSSPKTGLGKMTADEIRARIKAIEERTRKTPPAEAPKPEPAKVEPTVAAPIEAAVPELSVQDKIKALKQQALEETQGDSFEWNRARDKGIGIGPKLPDPDRVEPSRLEAKQMEMKARQTEAQAQDKASTDLLKANRAAKRKELDALRQTASSPEMGRAAAPPEAAKPAAEPLQAAPKAEGSGEPVRAAAQPPVTSAEPRSSRGEKLLELARQQEQAAPTPKAAELGAREPQPVKGPGLPPKAEFDSQVAEYLKRHPNMAEGTAKRIIAEKMRNERGSFSFSGDEPRDIRREAKIKGYLDDLRNPKASPEQLDTAYNMLTKVFDFSHDDIIQRMAGGADFAKTPEEGRLNQTIGELSDTVDKVMDRHGWGQENAPLPMPNKTEWDALNHERYELVQKLQGHGIGLDDMGEGRWDVEDANGKWHKDVQSDFMPQHLQADFTRLKEVSQKLQEHLNEYARINKENDAKFEASKEGLKQGTASVGGVKDPAQVELERMFGLKDERGFLSFRRLTPAQRAAANPVTRLADALDRVANFFEGRGKLTDEEAGRQQTAKNVIRGAKAELERSHLEVMEALKSLIEKHDSPVNERDNFIQFMDAGEGKQGAQFLAPEDQAIASVLHDMFKERWDKVKDVKGLEGEGIENYMAHLWEKPGKAQSLLTGILQGKRPLEGKAGFLRTRFYDYASEGVQHGLTPVTWNPIRMQLAALFEVDKFLMAHDIKDSFKEADLVKWHSLKDYKNVPNGWQRLDDKIFQPKVVGEGALKEYGTYYAPPEVAKVFNRFLSPGLRGDWRYDALHTYGNDLNMANLGLSAYHATFISLVSGASDVALGLQKVFNYGDFGGLKDIARGSLGVIASAARDYSLGREIQSEAIDPTGNVQLQKYVDALVKGGGRFKQDPFYTDTMASRKGFVNWLKLAPQGKLLEMARTGVRAASGPIMDKFVPRVKLGVAARMMEAKLTNLQKNGINDTNTIATEMGKIWDSVDNRAGQMVYDNLFWNKVSKDLSFLAVRAVGWGLGSIREFGGAGLTDLPRQAAKVLRGQRPELTHRLAFTIAMPITVGTFGAMVHYLTTGQIPRKPEDYFYPGPKGAKVSIPSYIKDMAGVWNDPVRTALDKAHPMWSQVYEGLVTDADYYGTEIRHPGDSVTKQGYDFLKWYGKTWEPFGVQGIGKRMERGEPAYMAASGFFGLMPAPHWIEQSKAEQLATSLSSRDWKRGPRTAGDFERHELVQSFQRQVASGHKLDMNVLTQAWRDKKIQDSDINKIYSSYGTPKLQLDFKELNLPDALAVMREADPNERVQLKPLLLEKYGQIERYPLDQQKAYDRQIRQFIQ